MNLSGKKTPQFQVTVVATTSEPKTQPQRNSFLWANHLIIDDMDERCPVIEG